MSTFDWVRRMGTHEAYHASRANRIIHWICIPIELFCVVKLLSLLSWGWIDLALVITVAVGIVYLATDVFAGALMVLFLLGLRAIAHRMTSGSIAIDALGALLLFVASFLFQTRVGHGVFEKGIDDTEINLAELRRTKNPIPILLVFYYHLVEILFALGYRKSLRASMEDHRRAARERIPDDPR